jgi:cytidine deaminase
VESLIKKSRDAMTKAYCPYSSFPVGAAILCEDGSVFTGEHIIDVTL